MVFFVNNWEVYFEVKLDNSWNNKKIEVQDKSSCKNDNGPMKEVWNLCNV